MFLGYGGGIEIDTNCFWYVDREDSFFKKKVIELTSSYHFDVWTVVEHVPADWEQINVELLHVYHDHFDMEGARLTIKVAPQQLILGNLDALPANLEEVYSADFPTDDDKETEKLIHEQVATIRVPVNI